MDTQVHTYDSLQNSLFESFDVFGIFACQKETDSWGFPGETHQLESRLCRFTKNTFFGGEMDPHVFFAMERPNLQREQPYFWGTPIKRIVINLG